MQRFAAGDSVFIRTKQFDHVLDGVGTYLGLEPFTRLHQVKVTWDVGEPLFLFVGDEEIEPDFEGSMRERIQPIVESHCGDRMVEADMADFIDTLIQAIHGEVE